MERIPVGAVKAFVVLFILVAFYAGAQAQTEKPEAFYKGKVINYIVGDPPSGSGGLVALALAPYLSKATGATVVVKNLSGGGGLEGPNFVWNAKPDGLTIGGLDLASLISNDMNDEPGAHYEVEKFGFLGSAGVEGTVLFVGAKSPIKTIEDLKAKKGLKFAGTTPSGMRGITLMVASYCLDLDARIVTGFKGGKDADLSVIQSETDGSGQTSGSYLRQEEAKLIRGIFAIDNRRVPGVSHIPPLTELVKLPKEKQDLLDLILIFRPSKGAFVTPGVPKDRLKFLQGVYAQTLKREDFNKELEKIMGYNGVHSLGAEEALALAQKGKANEKVWQERLQFLFKKYRASL